MAEPHPATVSTDIAPSAERPWHWLTAYTRSQHEAVVARQLEAKAVSFLLPTHLRQNPRFVWEILRQMAGRKATTT